MRGAAERPNGSNGAPDGRSGREPESASFEIARVPSRRASPPIFILGFLAVVGAIVAVGVGGGSSGQPSFPPVAFDSPVVTAAPTSSPSPAPTSPSVRPFGSTGTQVYASGTGPIELQARRLSTSMYIHGDVFVPQVTWVFVSLQDDIGRVAGWASVSVPGAAGPARDKGPNLRFDVEMAVPDGFSGRLWLHANAYDADGIQMASTRLEVSAGTY